VTVIGTGLLYVFVGSGNSYKFQAGSRALALDWCRHIDRAAKFQQPKVHLSSSPIVSLCHSSVIDGYCNYRSITSEHLCSFTVGGHTMLSEHVHCRYISYLIHLLTTLSCPDL